MAHGRIVRVRTYRGRSLSAPCYTCTTFGPVPDIREQARTEDKHEHAVPTKHPLLEKVENKTAVIGIVGLGYVGLPLVQAFMNAGFRTMGYDVDESKVAKLLEGKSYIGHITGEWIADCIKDGRFTPTADMSRLNESDAILICVPTPLSESRDPDLTYVEDTTRMIAKTLRPGQLVVLESTTYPGTTRDVMLPILAATGLTVGKDFFLAYSPEREDPGNIDFSASGIPKVVGGIDPLERRDRHRHVLAGRRPNDPRLVAAKWPRPARSWKTPIAR